MPNELLLLAGFGATVSFSVLFFSLAYAFNREAAGRVMRSEWFHQLAAISLVCLLCGAIAMMIIGFVGVVGIAPAPAIGVALVVFLLVHLTIREVWRRTVTARQLPPRGAMPST